MREVWLRKLWALWEQPVFWLALLMVLVSCVCRRVARSRDRPTATVSRLVGRSVRLSRCFMLSSLLSWVVRYWFLLVCGGAMALLLAMVLLLMLTVPLL